MSLTFWGFVFASILWVVLVPPWTIPWDVMAGPSMPFGDTDFTSPVWVIAIWNVLLGTIAPFLLVLGALRRLGAQRTGIVGTSEPMFAAVIAAVLIGEAISGIQAIGGLVVIAGILLAESARKPANDPEGSLPNPV
jgi:drug/metabolite transporter (DMT)-like permease